VASRCPYRLDLRAVAISFRPHHGAALDHYELVLVLAVLKLTSVMQ
jgi:hypothetical protein